MVSLGALGTAAYAAKDTWERAIGVAGSGPPTPTPGTASPTFRTSPPGGTPSSLPPSTPATSPTGLDAPGPTSATLFALLLTTTAVLTIDVLAHGDMTDHEIRATPASYAGLCMAVDGDTVVTAKCIGAKSEQWTTDDAGRMVSSDGRCMDPAGVGGGQPLLVTSCTTSDTQKWHFANGRIMSGELCLTIWGPYTTPGTHIQTWNTQQDPTLANEMYWELA